ncbi:hypothetical protein BDY21DRAFT_361106 [Lineolata rhizophorae]|uniref:Secreted protein n=1 Tax=Lineolata rhizophorae TaxID=578093 RepID=A0A6A6PBF3_9PEZI|nr:hypothetical protein BDY21DRAFT_361106 [Lineolata rhizophorae]
MSQGDRAAGQALVIALLRLAPPCSSQPRLQAVLRTHGSRVHVDGTEKAVRRRYVGARAVEIPAKDEEEQGQRGGACVRNRTLIHARTCRGERRLKPLLRKKLGRVLRTRAFDNLENNSRRRTRACVTAEPFSQVAQTDQRHHSRTYYMRGATCENHDDPNCKVPTAQRFDRKKREEGAPMI